MKDDELNFNNSEETKTTFNQENAYSDAPVWTQPMKEKKTSKKWVAVGLAGLCLMSAAVGGLTTIALAPRVFPDLLTSAPTFNTQSASTPAIKLSANQTNFPVEQIAKAVGPAVVGIANYQSPQNSFSGFPSSQGSSGGFSFGQGSNANSGLQEVDSGSGFIIDAKNGYIVTNDHVINGAQKIMVSLSDGRNIQAKVVGADPRTDLAVLQIPNTKNLTAVSIGDSSNLEVGEPVVAIGNPGGNQFARSVTTGVVSATDRMLNIQGEDSFNLIQTDAAINPGNSGGPLVDYQGKVIGINSAKYAEQGYEGMGFSIPISDAMPTIEQLIKTGVAEHPALLVTINDQYDNYAQNNNLPQGAYIASVSANGPAANAGLKAGDVITKIDNYQIQSSSDLVHALYQYKVGDKVTVTFVRNGQTKQVQATLGKISSNQ